MIRRIFDKWFRIDHTIRTQDTTLEETLMSQAKPIDPTIRVRRVSIYEDAGGEFRFRAQGGNWRVIPSAEQGVKTKRSCMIRALRTYPQTEELVDLTLPDGSKSYMLDELEALKTKLFG
jgi:uncharacterized protein YegP (UPF0339 family)